MYAESFTLAIHEYNVHTSRNEYAKPVSLDADGRIPIDSHKA